MFGHNNLYLKNTLIYFFYLFFDKYTLTSKINLMFTSHARRHTFVNNSQAEKTGLAYTAPSFVPKLTYVFGSFWINEL